MSRLTLSEDVIKSIGSRLSKLERGPSPAREFFRLDGDDRHVRLGRTSRVGKDYDGAYPTSGNLFWVELGNISWSVATCPANVGITWESYDPPEYRPCKTFDDGWVAEGTYVHITLTHGRWVIIDNPKFYRFTLLESLSGGPASATITNMQNQGNITADVIDSFDIFSDLGIGKRGICVRQNGGYYIIQSECP